MLPGIQGLDVAKILKAREETSHIPIIMLTAKSEDTDVVLGLEMGADDYVTKPFSPRVLVARIKAVLRKSNVHTKEGVLKFNDLHIHIGPREVYWKGQRIQLTNTEYKILLTLAKKPNWVFSRYQIVDMVHGENYAVTDRSVDVLVSSLRKKLGEAGMLIETVRGVGYKLRFQDAN
jgi:two-component system phosphate regulon response regulator PhoB